MISDKTRSVLKTSLMFNMVFIVLFIAMPFANLLATDNINSSNDIDMFLKSMQGVEGLGTLGIVAASVQALLFLLKKNFNLIKPKYKLIVVTFLTLFAGIVSLRIEGLDWPSCILHSTTLASMQVFIHQFSKTFKKKSYKSKT